MRKKEMKPGNMLYPVPAALISARGKDGRTGLLTAAWCGTVCSDPPMLSVSIKKSRFTHHLIEESREFTVNLTTEEMARAVDLCGVISGKDVDKWEKSGLHEEEGLKVSAPSVQESPVSIECKVTQILELGSHDMFLGEVVSVRAAEEFFDETGRFDLDKARLMAYSHGEYRALGKVLGTFGFSVRKNTKNETSKAGKKPERKRK